MRISFLLWRVIPKDQPEISHKHQRTVEYFTVSVSYLHACFLACHNWLYRISNMLQEESILGLNPCGFFCPSCSVLSPKVIQELSDSLWLFVCARKCVLWACCERAVSVLCVCVCVCVHCITMLRLSSIREVPSVEPLISILNNAVDPGARERSDHLTL